MERIPNQHTHWTDADAIDFAVEAAHHHGHNIDDATARVIASQWHGGQASDLYSFVSTGAISDQLVDEIAQNWASLPEDDPKRHQLELLAEYIRHRESHGSIEGWSQLWLAPPDHSGWSDSDHDHCPACDAHIAEPHSEECPLNPENWEDEE